MLYCFVVYNVISYSAFVACYIAYYTASVLCSVLCYTVTFCFVAVIKETASAPLETSGTRIIKKKRPGQSKRVKKVTQFISLLL